MSSNFCFSALQRAEIAEIAHIVPVMTGIEVVSVLFNEPKLLKYRTEDGRVVAHVIVSVLFNEPKLLKSETGIVVKLAGL